MFAIFRFRLSFKIFLSFLIVIIFPSFISFFISYRLILRTINHDTILRLQDSISGFNEEIKLIEKRCLYIAKQLSENKEIKMLFYGNEFENLEKKLIEIHELAELDIVEIEDEEGKVILRGHNPGKYGDIKVDQNLIRMGLSGKSMVSYERGLSGFAIRAVSPIVEDDNKTRGLVMIGTSFSKNFVDHIKILTGMDNGIYKEN